MNIYDEQGVVDEIDSYVFQNELIFVYILGIENPVEICVLRTKENVIEFALNYIITNCKPHEEDIKCSGENAHDDNLGECYQHALGNDEIEEIGTCFNHVRNSVWSCLQCYSHTPMFSNNLRLLKRLIPTEGLNIRETSIYGTGRDESSGYKLAKVYKNNNLFLLNESCHAHSSAKFGPEKDYGPPECALWACMEMATNHLLGMYSYVSIPTRIH